VFQYIIQVLQYSLQIRIELLVISDNLALNFTKVFQTCGTNSSMMMVQRGNNICDIPYSFFFFFFFC